MRELVASNDNCDQACDLRNCTGEEGLHCGESGIERRLRNGQRREEEQQSKEAKSEATPAETVPLNSLQPAFGREHDNHRHLQRPRSGRDMPKRKLESLAASNNFLEVGYNFLDLDSATFLALRYADMRFSGVGFDSMAFLFRSARLLFNHCDKSRSIDAEPG